MRFNVCMKKSLIIMLMLQTMSHLLFMTLHESNLTRFQKIGLEKMVVEQIIHLAFIKFKRK